MNNLDNSFNYYLMSVLTLNIIVLRNYRIIFGNCHNFYLIFLIFGRSIFKNKKNPISVG